MLLLFSRDYNNTHTYIDDSTTFVLDPRLIAKLAAKVLFKEKNVWNRDNFMTKWRESLRAVFEIESIEESLLSVSEVHICILVNIF